MLGGAQSAVAAQCQATVGANTVVLNEDEADPQVWEDACPDLLAFLNVPNPPWASTLPQQAAHTLLQLDYFRDAQCTVQDATLRCDLQPQYIVTTAQVQGSLPITLQRDDVRHRLFLRPGARVTNVPQAVLRQQQRLMTYLRGEGFPDAQVHVHSEADDSDTLHLGLRVVVDVDTGPPLEMGEVHVQGNVPVDKVRKAFVHPILFRWGQLRYRRAQLDDDVAAYTADLQEQGWPAARVQVKTHRRDGVCDLDVIVDPGPQVELHFVGNEALSESTLRDLATFRSAGAVDALEVENTRIAILQKYQEEGFDSADLETQDDRASADADHFTATFTVHEGPRRHIDSVLITGNHVLDGSPEALADAAEMLTRPSSAIIKRHWVDAWVRHDVQTLLGYYHTHGYPEAKVEASRTPVANNTVQAVFAITEGPHHTVYAVQTPGLPSGLLNDVQTRLQLRANGPFDAQEVDADGDMVRALLASQGYLQARVLSSATHDAQGDTVQYTITHLVNPGPQAVRSGLLVSGNQRTRRSTFSEEMPGFDGDILDVGALGNAQKRLAALRVFNSVQLRPLVSALDPNNPNTWIVATVQEQETRSLDAVVSFSTDDDFGVGFDFRDRNLLGRALALDVSVRVGNADELINPHLRIGNVDHLEAKLRAPRPFGLPFDAEADALYEFDDRALYRYRTQGGNGTLTRAILQRTDCAHCPTITLRLGYQLVEAEYTQLVDTPTNILPLGAPTYIPSATIGRIIPGFSIDGRDSVLDPHKGYFLDVRQEVAHPVLAGPLAHQAVAFWRFITSLQGYIPLFNARVARLDETHWLGGPLLLALSIQYNAAGPWTAHGSVPTSETFAYGGDFSVRGLNNSASSVVMFAHSMVVGGAEVRWTVADLWIGTLALGAFTDVGTIAAAPRLLFGQTTVSVGPVLRYVTPVGPLALAYGIAVVRPPALAAVPAALPPHGRVHFSFGTSF